MLHVEGTVPALILDTSCGTGVMEQKKHVRILSNAVCGRVG